MVKLKYPLKLREREKQKNKQSNAEDTLRESEEMFRTLAEESPNMIFINKKNRVVYANKECELSMGYGRDEFYSLDFEFFNLIAPEYRDLVKANFGKHLHSEEVPSYECAMITKWGKKIDTIITSRLIKYGGERAILGIVTDITERKRTMEELNRLNEELERKVIARTDAMRKHVEELTLLQKVNDALNSSLPLEQVLQIIVDGITSSFGYDGSGITLLDEDKNNLHSIVVSYDTKMLAHLEKFTKMTLKNYRTPLFEGSMYKKLVEKKVPILTEDIVAVFEHFTDDEKLKPLARGVAKITGFKSAVGVPLTAKGKVIGTLGAASTGKLTIEDVQRLERIASQAGLAIKKIRLEEEKVKLEHQLYQADKLASVGLLAAGVAHGINNPLTAISLNTEMLMKKVKKSELKEKLRAIEEQVNIAASIIKNLLDFSRDMKPELRMIDVNEIIKKDLETLSVHLKNIKVTKDFNKIQKISGDSSQLHQVFMNIIINAIHAMPKGGLLKISTKEEDSSVLVTISDTGIGITKEHLRRIFDPFFTTKEVGKGTGLGLSICHGIVKEHGGTIEVESNVGKGSTFRVRLPVGVKHG